MWSVGIISFLLLLGHSPFNVALRESDQQDRETQVIRLASKAEINTDSRAWSCMTGEAQDFIIKALQIDASKRLTPGQAFNHPFIAQGAVKGGRSTYLTKLPPLLPVAGVVWKRIDEFQRLCWIAFAHAIAEPELVEVRVFQMFIAQQGMDPSSYLERLAVEIAAVAQPSWFQRKSVWLEILRLAFHYLDVDNDGILSAEDLSRHLVTQQGALEQAEEWVTKWQQSQGLSNNMADGNNLTNGNGLLANNNLRGLSFGNFKWALCSSHVGQRFSAEANGMANAHAGNKTKDATLEQQTHAIDEVCQRFLDEEFEVFGFGL